MTNSLNHKIKCLFLILCWESIVSNAGNPPLLCFARPFLQLFSVVIFGWKVKWSFYFRTFHLFSMFCFIVHLLCKVPADQFGCIWMNLYRQCILLYITMHLAASVFCHIIDKLEWPRVTGYQCHASTFHHRVLTCLQMMLFDSDTGWCHLSIECWSKAAQASFSCSDNSFECTVCFQRNNFLMQMSHVETNPDLCTCIIQKRKTLRTSKHVKQLLIHWKSEFTCILT